MSDSDSNKKVFGNANTAETTLLNNVRMSAPKQFEISTASIAAPAGWLCVPCLRHPKCPGLAITSEVLGYSNVTQTVSGKGISPVEANFGISVYKIAIAQRLAVEHNFRWDVEPDELMETLKARGNDRGTDGRLKDCIDDLKSAYIDDSDDRALDTGYYLLNQLPEVTE